MERWTRVVVAIEIGLEVQDLASFDHPRRETVISSGCQSYLVVVDVEIFSNRDALFLLQLQCNSVKLSVLRVNSS